MDALELLERYNSKKIGISEVLEWCRENLENIDFTDGNQHNVYELAVRFLMSDDKLGQWNKKDVEIIIIYLANSILYMQPVTTRVLEQEEYEKKYNESSNAMCVLKKDGTGFLDYSQNVVNLLLSNDYWLFLDGMRIIYHEVVHVMQRISMQQPLRKNQESGKFPTKNTYIIALETFARQNKPEIYYEYYDYLFKENQANMCGLMWALESISKYNPEFALKYKESPLKEKIEQDLKKYQKTFFDATVTMPTGREAEFLKWIQALCSQQVKKHPEILMENPILQVGYNLDGTEKDLKQLLLEREDWITNSEMPIEKINELYDVIINHRVIASKLVFSEIDFLEDYIKRTGTEDEFIFAILEGRLKKCKLSPEQESSIIQKNREIAAKIRAERKRIEGDVAKKEDGLEAEQPGEEVWTNRFQIWEQKAANMPNIAQNQTGIVSAIQGVGKDVQLGETEDKRGNRNE